MSESPAKQASFSGWAIVEIMGHQKHIGYVTTEAFGAAVLFRCDTPQLDEREFVLTAPEYVGHRWTPAGAKVQRPASPASTALIGPGSVYRMSPCTEEAARQAIENTQARPLILIEMPAGLALAAGTEERPEVDRMDPNKGDSSLVCFGCGEPEDYCKCV